MALTPHYGKCGCRSGGVRRVSLARASAVKNVTFDGAGRSVTALSLTEEDTFVDIHTCEASASLHERAEWKNGAMTVCQELRFTVEAVDACTAALAEQIAGASRAGGLVALVQTEAGETILGGYSFRLGTEQPRRLLETVADTRARRADKPSRTFVLGCTLDAPAMSCLFDLP